MGPPVLEGGFKWPLLGPVGPVISSTRPMHSDISRRRRFLKLFVNPRYPPRILSGPKNAAPRSQRGGRGFESLVLHKKKKGHGLIVALFLLVPLQDSNPAEGSGSTTHRDPSLRRIAEYDMRRAGTAPPCSGVVASRLPWVGTRESADNPLCSTK